MLGTLKTAALNVRRFALLNARRLSNSPIVRHEGVKLELGDHLSPSVNYYIRNGDYERRECKGIRGHIRPDDVVMELGAGIGFISLFCARAIGADRVHAFEANPALEPIIRRNYAINGLHPHLEIGILGDDDGRADFFVSRDLWESSMVHHDPHATRVSVPVRRLDRAVDRIKPTFLIMDIEGGEREIIDRIDLATVRKVAIETHANLIGQDAVDAIGRKLVAAGFAIDRRYTKGQQLVAARP